MPTTFDLFGTLVAAERPDDPAAAVADALAARGVHVPADWATAYREPHADADEGAERPLPAHVADALASRGVDASRDTVREATLAAFDRPVEPRPGARDAVAAAAARGPVGVLSNCSVPGLVERALARAALAGDVDAVVSSVDCGWGKPDPRAFEAVADELGVPPGSLVHVGDDPATDGGADAAGGRSVLLDDTPLTDLPAELEGDSWD
ncbi:MAG: HAD family hydrolase [Halobacterium sp.]